MHDASLDMSFWKDASDTILQTGHPIHGQEQDILNAPVLDGVKDVEPRALRFPRGNPQPQDVFPAMHINAQDDIHGMVCRTAVLPLDTNPYTVHEDKSIQGGQRPVLPFMEFCHDAVRHRGYPVM